MGLRIEPYSSAYASGIARLNARLQEAHVDAALRLPVDGPDESVAFSSEPDEPLAKRQYLLVDNGDVRGGFIIQEQRFQIAGQIRWIANIQMPISEGVVDRRYALVALQMTSMILASKPLLFAVGMGGSLDQPFARLVATMGWPIGLVPFAFYVLRPGRFLQHIRAGRTFPGRSLLAEVAARSGIGWLGVRSLHAASGLRRRLGTRRPRTVTPERVTCWGEEWTDVVWNAYRGECSFAATRDCHTLPLFHPLSHQPLQAYRFLDDDGRVVGWAALQLRAMIQNQYFGDMLIATVLDALAVPGWEDSIMTTVTELATEAGADVIISNQHHRAWRQAQWRGGFIEARSNYLLALSPRLAAVLNPLERGYDHVHITRADGDGRVNL